ncbi:hypothetical protein RRG08_062707 [Elysia crispata]|uniref:Uncharacterized protein n=1 Tax=Elysia crispata TaxID=231223 RepID=A0AAE1AE20_9GAST|nr:hypothetical protein RRG08_062707 [Elysia crispata]
MFWMFRETKGREKCQGGEVNKRLKVKSNFHVDQMLKVEYVEEIPKQPEDRSNEASCTETLVEQISRRALEKLQTDKADNSRSLNVMFHKLLHQEGVKALDLVISVASLIPWPPSCGVSVQRQRGVAVQARQQTQDDDVAGPASVVHQRSTQTVKLTWPEGPICPGQVTRNARDSSMFYVSRRLETLGGGGGGGGGQPPNLLPLNLTLATPVLAPRR